MTELFLMDAYIYNVCYHNCILLVELATKVFTFKLTYN
jgi:hypothetical protein